MARISSSLPQLKALSHASEVWLIAHNYYLALGNVFGEQCFVASVKKLPPAHASRVGVEHKRTQEKRFKTLVNHLGITTT